MAIQRILKIAALWTIGVAILVISGAEFWMGPKWATLALGLLAAVLVLPPVRSRLPPRVLMLVPAQMTFIVVMGLMIWQIYLTSTGQEARQAAQQVAEQQHLRSLTVARRQSFADSFVKNKLSILAAIQTRVTEGKLSDALAEAQKYDNADADLDALKHSLEVGVLRQRLQNEASVPLEQRAAAYTELARLEPGNPVYAAKSQKLNEEAAQAHEKAVAKSINHLRLLEQFSWDGSNRYVEAAIKGRMNNPDSYKHVETKYRETPEGAVIYTKFRGTNGFGAIMTTAAVATVDSAGSVTSLDMQ